MKQTIRGGYLKPQRDSNFELLRILAMMAIIAHHYVVNSTVKNLFDYENPTIQQYFLSVWGMWGKTAINSFVLISGYFLCKGRLTWQRWVKLFTQMLFYSYLIMIIFGLTGYEPITINGIASRLTNFLGRINNGFGSSFMCFYAFVPVYNKLLDTLSKKQHLLFIGGLVTIFTVSDTFFYGGVFNEPFWYMALYMIAAYIRLYPNKWLDSLKLTSLALVASVLAAIASVIMVTYIRKGDLCHFFGADSDKALALAVGLSAFLAAKNLPKFHNKVINFFSTGTFAVLLIHASSNTMRHWLWQDVCQMPKMLTADMPTLALHAIVIPPIIFLLCSSVDWLRREYLEKPFMRWLNKISFNNGKQ